MANDKVFSVRADDATIAQLDKIAEESGLKKAEILPVLLTSYATAQAKSILPGRATEIENVGNLLDQIKTAYLASLELNANAEERIRAEFIARIENNEQAMSSLKEKADAATADAKDAKSALADLTKERDALAKRAEAAENELAKEREAAAEEKDRLVKFNESLQAQVEALKEKAEAATAELQAAAALEEESAKAKSELQAAIQRAEKAEAEAAELSKKLMDATTIFAKNWRTKNSRRFSTSAAPAKRSCAPPWMPQTKSIKGASTRCRLPSTSSRSSAINGRRNSTLCARNRREANRPKRLKDKEVDRHAGRTSPARIFRYGRRMECHPSIFEKAPRWRNRDCTATARC